MNLIFSYNYNRLCGSGGSDGSDGGLFVILAFTCSCVFVFYRSALHHKSDVMLCEISNIENRLVRRTKTNIGTQKHTSAQLGMWLWI